ncbi:MAG: M28 family peptidase, partial [Clostridia bacterium]
KANSDGELAVAMWLRDKLLGRAEVKDDKGAVVISGIEGFGYQNIDVNEFSNTNAGLSKFEFKYTDDAGKEQLGKSYNVSATKKAVNSKGEIILGTYYDNSFGVKVNDKPIVGDGSYESGASVATLLTIAQQLAKMQDLQYDITIVFFGAGSVGYIGAGEYVANMSLERKDNVKLMINFNQIVGGKNMYMYSRDFGTDYNDYFYEVAKVNGVDAKKVPANKNISKARLSEDSLQNYFHIGMVGNNYYFMNSKIPTVNFMSFDWSSNKNFYNTEYDGSKNVFQTDNDTIGNLVERCGGVDIVKAKMNDIIKTTLLALSGGYSQSFDKALSTASKQEVNEKAQNATTASALSITIKVLLVVAVVAIMFAVKNYLQKNKDKYVINIPNENGEPNAPKQDVFEEFFTKKNDSGNNVENDGDNDNGNNSGNSGNSDVFEGF